VAGDEEEEVPRMDYSYGGWLPRELDGRQVRTQELDGGGEDAARYKLDGTGGKILVDY
jgi:hypothetical protein